MQEALLAGSRGVLRCGKDSLPLPLFRRGIEAIAWRLGIPQSVLSPITRARDLIHYGKRVPFTQLVARAQARKCTRAHDKIYGILSVMPRGLANRIMPDYSKSTAEVFRDLLLQNFEATGRLDLIQRCCLTNSDAVTPSWIPALWDSPSTFVAPSYGDQASGTSRAFCQYIPPDVLTVTGVIVTMVKTVGGVLPKESDSLIHALINPEQAQLVEDCSVNGEDSIDSYLRTLLFGATRDRLPGLPSAPTIAELRHAFFNAKSKFPTDAMKRRLVRASFFTTHDGYVGLGPSSARTGK